MTIKFCYCLLDAPQLDGDDHDNTDQDDSLLLEDGENNADAKGQLKSEWFMKYQFSKIATKIL